VVFGAIFNLRDLTGFSFPIAMVDIGLLILQAGSGAFLLGTLCGRGLNTWLATTIYVVPLLLLQILAIFGGNSQPIMPIVCAVLNPFVSFYCVRAGQNRSNEFCRSKAALNVPWMHWIWLVPTSLYQAVGVPVFLFLYWWKIDCLAGDAVSISSLPGIALRTIVFFLFLGVLAAMRSAYRALAQDSDSISIRVLKVAGTWLLLSVLQGAIFLDILVIGKHYEKADQKGAIQQYSKLISLEPQNPKAYIRRGKEFSNGEKFQNAIEDYTKAISLDPKNVNAFIGRGDALSQLKKWNEAIKDYSQAIALDSSNVTAYVRREEAFTQLGLNKESEADYSKAIAIEPKDADGYVALGTAYQDYRNHQQAIKEFTVATRFDPNDPGIYSDRCLSNMRLGQKAKAMADGALATSLIPNDSKSFLERGTLYNKGGAYEKAIADLTHAISIQPNYVQAYVQRGNAYHQLGEDTAATRDYDEAKTLSHSSVIDKEVSLAGTGDLAGDWTAGTKLLILMIHVNQQSRNSKDITGSLTFRMEQKGEKHLFSGVLLPREGTAFFCNFVDRAHGGRPFILKLDGNRLLMEPHTNEPGGQQFGVLHRPGGAESEFEFKPTAVDQRRFN
jgi:tetratricopeptide (TPR) repeat protein